MDIAVTNITQAFRVYQNQSRIGELNRQSGLKTVQAQADRVTLSAQAVQLAVQAEEQAIAQAQVAPATVPFGPQPQFDSQPIAGIGPTPSATDTFQPIDFS